MNPEQLNKLREISESFQQGTASHENIKQLNDILTMINHGHNSKRAHEESEKTHNHE